MTPDMFAKEAHNLMAATDQLFYQNDYDEPEALARQLFVKAFIAGMQRFAWWQDGVQMVGTCGTTFKKACEDVITEAAI